MALAYFRRLYLLERELKPLSNEDRKTQRQSRALPILNALKSWIDKVHPRRTASQLVRQGTELRPQPLGRVGSVLRRRLVDHRQHTEQTRLRAIAVGRRNWLFYGSDAGGHSGSILSTILGSDKVNRVSPYPYLHDVFQRLPSTRRCCRCFARLASGLSSATAAAPTPRS